MLDLEWSTQAVFVVTFLISSQIVSTLDELLARAVGLCGGVCLCVLSLGLGLRAGNESVIGIAFHF